MDRARVRAKKRNCSAEEAGELFNSVNMTEFKPRKYGDSQIPGFYLWWMNEVLRHLVRCAFVDALLVNACGKYIFTRIYTQQISFR